ncbi:MAG: Pr6Pr family membrane protein [Gemmobacter sp.]
MTIPARLAALAVFLISGLALRAQFDVTYAVAGSGARTLWLMAGYFTILTNLLLAGHMAAVAMGWRIGASRAAGMLLSILVVGIVYHAVLAGLWAPQGMAWWADQGLHSAAPLGMLVWWWVFAPKGVGWRDLPTWLVWPLAYCGYALLRGALTGFWPYPFLDAGVLGWPVVAAHVAGMVAGFAVLGTGIVAVARSVRQARLIQ